QLAALSESFRDHPAAGHGRSDGPDAAHGRPERRWPKSWPLRLEPIGARAGQPISHDIRFRHVVAAASLEAFRISVLDAPDQVPGLSAVSGKHGDHRIDAFQSYVSRSDVGCSAAADITTHRSGRVTEAQPERTGVHTGAGLRRDHETHSPAPANGAVQRL